MDFKWIALFVICCLQGCQREAQQQTQSPPGEPLDRPVEVQSEQEPETAEVTIDTLLKKGMTSEEVDDVLKPELPDCSMMSMRWLSEAVRSPKFPGRSIQLFYWLEPEGELSFQEGGTLVYRLDSWSVSPVE